MGHQENNPAAVEEIAKLRIMLDGAKDECAALKKRMEPLLVAANELLNCADQDVARFGIEVPAEIAWKFAHAVRHAEGAMPLLEDCAHCWRSDGK